MDNYLGEIRIFSFGIIPNGWVQCNGQTLQIQQNQALYSLLGVFYGGDGKTTFQLPDLRGRAMFNAGTSAVSGTSYQVGVKGQGGVESVTLTGTQTPIHIHTMTAVSANGNALLNSAGAPEILAAPVISTLPATVPNAFTNQTSPALTPLIPNSMSMVGGGAVHENRVPLLALNICIAVTGIYPPRP